MKLIVVEGPDGSGKTTLIRNLRQSSKEYFFVLNASGPPRNVADLKAAVRLLSFSTYQGVQVICDRHLLISDPIYGPILRGKDLVSNVASTERLQEELKGTIERIIYCRPLLGTILKSVRVKPQLEGVISKTEQIVKAYDESMERLRKIIPIIRYDWTVPLESSFDDLFFGELK